MSLNPDRQALAAYLVKTGRKRGEGRKKIAAALETGLVESNLTNLSGGDADSAGWRQERASLYKDPTNLKASTNRFYDELDALGNTKGVTAGEMAARVQRPAAQYRGRYQERKGDALSILRSINGGGGSSGRAAAAQGAGETTQEAIPGSTLEKKTSFDQAGFEQAQKNTVLGQLLAKRNPNSLLIKLGVTPTTAPNAADFSVSKLQNTSNQPGVNNPKADAPVAGQGVSAVLRTANKIDKIAPEYVWGGGHQPNPKIKNGLDCSGAVSYALNSAGLLKGSLVSGALAKYGKPGPGKQVTIYANDTHVFMKIGNRYWGTSGTWRPNGGAGWFTGTPPASYLANFTQRHPPGQ